MNNLKTLVTIFLIGMAMNVANGQFGVRAGANLASLKVKVDFLGTSLAVETDDKLGGHIGVYYKTAMTESVTIRTNLIYTTGGGKVNDETTGESNSVNASYLGIPIDVMYAVPVGENSLSLMGGPFFGYLLSSSSDEGSSDEDEFSSVDYGLNFGLQFQIKELGIGLTYGLGLANVIPDEVTSTDFFEGASANTRILSLFFTYDL